MQKGIIMNLQFKPVEAKDIERVTPFFALRPNKTCDSVILDYLCEHFNGTVDQMYRVLMQGIKEHVETYDLEERLVAQMLFTGCTEKMDRVFELYASRKKTIRLIYCDKIGFYFGEAVYESEMRRYETKFVKSDDIRIF